MKVVMFGNQWVGFDHYETWVSVGQGRDGTILK